MVALPASVPCFEVLEVRNQTSKIMGEKTIIVHLVCII